MGTLTNQAQRVREMYLKLQEELEALKGEGIKDDILYVWVSEKISGVEEKIKLLDQFIKEYKGN